MIRFADCCVSFGIIWHYRFESMKRLKIVLAIPVLALLVSFGLTQEHLLPFTIPEQTFDIWTEMGTERLHDTVTVKSFDISPQIRYWEYKEYLAAVKKDSSAAFYKSQFPDSTMALPEQYRIYLNSSEYDSYPVAGVSWDNASNYLHWLTVKANQDTILDTIYRLPKVSEWVAANRYFKDKNYASLGWNKDYADWTLNAKDESFYEYYFRDRYGLNDYTYDALPDDAPVLKRKVVMGNSFHYSQHKLLDFYSWSYYENHGYAHISFRYVKKVLTKAEMEQEQSRKLKQLKYKIKKS